MMASLQGTLAGIALALFVDASCEAQAVTSETVQIKKPQNVRIEFTELNCPYLPDVQEALRNDLTTRAGIGSVSSSVLDMLRSKPMYSIREFMSCFDEVRHISEEDSDPNVSDAIVANVVFATFRLANAGTYDLTALGVQLTLTLTVYRNSEFQISGNFLI